jgi:hypothetical protein
MGAGDSHAAGLGRKPMTNAEKLDIDDVAATQPSAASPCRH